MTEKNACHGTTRENAKSILNNGFAYSLGNEHWLGDGVYFFVEGVGYTPDRAAELWAEYRAYKQHSQFCSLISSEINVADDAFLDLTSYDGIRILNYIQLKCAQKYNIRRRISNCTICAVYNKETISNIAIKKEWRIEQ